jgi:hypothetical protein
MSRAGRSLAAVVAAVLGITIALTAVLAYRQPTGYTGQATVVTSHLWVPTDDEAGQDPISGGLQVDLASAATLTEINLATGVPIGALRAGLALDVSTPGVVAVTYRHADSPDQARAVPLETARILLRTELERLRAQDEAELRHAQTSLSDASTSLSDFVASVTGDLTDEQAALAQRVAAGRADAADRARLFQVQSTIAQQSDLEARRSGAEARVAARQAALQRMESALTSLDRPDTVIASAPEPESRRSAVALGVGAAVLVLGIEVALIGRWLRRSPSSGDGARRATARPAVV